MVFNYVTAVHASVERVLDTPINIFTGCNYDVPSYMYHHLSININIVQHTALVCECIWLSATIALLVLQTELCNLLYKAATSPLLVEKQYNTIQHLQTNQLHCYSSQNISK